MSPTRFKDHEEFMEMLKEHKAREDKIPAVGAYSPHEPETKIEIDFSKAVPREPFKDEGLMEDQDVDGDVLILDPEKPKPHMPNINFDKQVPREVEKVDHEDANNGEELMLEPNIDAVKKRVPNLVNMEKQKGREEAKKLDDDEYFVQDFEFS